VGTTAALTRLQLSNLYATGGSAHRLTLPLKLPPALRVLRRGAVAASFSFRLCCKRLGVVWARVGISLWASSHDVQLWRLFVRFCGGCLPLSSSVEPTHNIVSRCYATARGSRRRLAGHHLENGGGRFILRALPRTFLFGG